MAMVGWNFCRFLFTGQVDNQTIVRGTAPDGEACVQFSRCSMQRIGMTCYCLADRFTVMVYSISYRRLCVQKT